MTKERQTQAVEVLGRAIGDLLPPDAADALAQIQLPVIEPADLAQNLARLRHHISPSFLPFATFDGSPLALHLFPGVEASCSPIVYIGTGSRAPKFICRQFSDLPRAAWLWVAGFHKKKIETLRESIATLETCLPGARPVPPVLWQILAEAGPYQPSWWGYRSDDATARAWVAADVGHPFAKLGTVDLYDAARALSQLREYLEAETQPAPEILAALAAAQVAAGEVPSSDILLEVLLAEAWLGGERIVEGPWNPMEPGIGAWSLTLKMALAQEGLLDRTPFAQLVGHPETYSGRDAAGPDLLGRVAGSLCAAGDHCGEVRQLRNSALLSFFTTGGYGRALCEDIAGACDRVESGSLAATLAQAYAAVDPDDA